MVLGLRIVVLNLEKDMLKKGHSKIFLHRSYFKEQMRGIFYCFKSGFNTFVLIKLVNISKVCHCVLDLQRQKTLICVEEAGC